MLVCALMLGGITARGAVIYSGYQEIAVPLNFDGVYLNLVTGSTTTTEPAGWATGPWINPFYGGVYITNEALVRPVVTGIDQAVNLSSGIIISSASTFATGMGGSITHVGPALNQFQIGTAGNLGFQFEAAPGGATRYGWMNLTVSNTGSGTINGWAYDDAAGAIVVGNITQSAPLAGAQTITLSAPLGESFTLGSALTNSGGNINSLIKTGAGATTLSGAHTFTGGTMVSGGVLNVTNLTGSATGTGALTIDAGAILSGTGRVNSGGNNIAINGTLSVGDVTMGSAVSSTLEIGSSTGGITLGSTGSLRFDLFSGVGAGNNTSTLNASDLLILYGDISLLSGSTLIIGNPSNMSAWAIGDQWRLWDVTNAGTRTGNFALASIIAPLLSGNDKAWNFDSSSGILSIIAPEPGRIALTFLGLYGLLLRRRRQHTR
ncbi:autotransporter-associated beta strand repeat-containing protein [Prosthecobacter sp.]|uniref:autotransporter-associated beta strand repeat-containing protein n=1 Tax=Prosthecobacter sp. TaxID=1965333 RepID=UPI0039046B51